MHLTLRRSLPHPPRQGRGGLVAVAIALATWTLGTLPALADTTIVDNAPAPIVRVNVRSGNVTIRTWSRPSVQIEGESTLSIVRHTMHAPSEQPPLLIPQEQARNARGFATLPPESFVVSTIAPGPHEAIVIKSTPQSPPGPVTVTVPTDAIFVFAFARHGNLDVRGYHGGTFVGFTTRGRLALHDVGGTIFAQTGAGALVVTDSATERMRARSLFGNITFERCNARQIEASSVDGSIAYDNGAFEPGLARFDSTHGDVAVGTENAAELGAHVAGTGHVYTNFEHGARVSGPREDTNAVVGGGGPVVSAMTQTGNIYLFDGSLRTRERLAAPWRKPIAKLPQLARLHDGIQRDRESFFTNPFLDPSDPPREANRSQARRR